jgi:hypothetical protein
MYSVQDYHNFLTHITANYRAENGKPLALAWIFSSQILEIEAPFAVLA